MATKPIPNPSYKFYFDGSDQTLVRNSKAGGTEILWPDLTWHPYQADLLHDYSPIDTKAVEGLIDRFYKKKPQQNLFGSLTSPK